MTATTQQNRPNPSNTGDQVSYAVDFALRVAGREAQKLGIEGILKLITAAHTGDWTTFLDIIKDLGDDPDVKRFSAIKDSYPANGLPVEAAGYYCVLVIANTDSGTNGWKPLPTPWGTPAT